MTIELEIVLAFVGMVGFYGAGDYEARHGELHHGVLWAGLSVLVSGIVFALFHGGLVLWLSTQVGLLVGIGAFRAWLESRLNG
ncbi:MAG TPA: hypothetical protein VJ833_12320 [Rhodanobacteraceae bacterium]|nr:hypothetical protein [Rhodanobacteraceae bacterium]